MKKKYFLTPESDTDYAIVENWLREKAKAGYILKKIGKYISTFEVSDRKDLSYLLDSDNRIRRSKDEKIAILKESGWEYVDDFNNIPIFVSEEKQEISNHEHELLDAYKFTLRTEVKKEWKYALISFLLFLFSISTIYYYQDFQPSYIFSGFTVVFLSLLIIDLYFIIHTSIRMLRLKKIIKEWENGNFIVGKNIIKFPLSRIVIRLFALCILIIMIISFIQFKEYSKDEIPATYKVFPIGESLSDEGNHYFNFVKANSIFMKYEDYDESIYEKNIFESIHLQLYESKLEFVQDYIKSYYVKDNYYRPIETNNQVDEFYLLYGSVNKDYYIRKDNYAIVVEYSGSMEEEQFQEILMEYLLTRTDEAHLQ